MARIGASGTGGSVPSFIWIDNIPSTQTFTIPVNYQSLGLFQFTINGVMVLNGTFMII